MSNPDPCVFAMKRYVDKLRWLNLWTLLLWIFGATVVVFCSVATLLFIRKTWLPGALTVLGTIVNGAGTAWVIARRKEAEAEERDAFKVFSVECADRKSDKKAAGVELLGLTPKAFSEHELRSIAWRSLFRGKIPDELA